MGLHHGQANFVTYGKPSLFLDFANKKSLTDRISGNNLITFTRSSTGTYVGSDGLIKTAAADEARFDHDPETGESLGLLIEESRTNLITYSEDFSQSVWTKQNGFSITSNTAIAPDGTLTADTASRVNLGAEYLYQNLNTPAGTYTLSCWIKSVNASSSFSIISYSGLDGSQSSSFTATNTWKRFSHTVTVSSPVTGFYPCIPSVSGEQFYIWGAQLEQGSFPTSYIPTSGSAVTRQPDNAQITGTNFTDFYNQSEGSFYSDIKLNPSFPVSGKASISFTLSDNSFNNRITLASSTGSFAFNADVNISGTVYRAVIGNYTSGSSSIRTSIGYKSADTAGSFDGASPVTSSPSGTLPLLTRADIGKDHTDFNHLSGHIRRITYYPQRLTNTQLQSLTS
jgi:hypothetical protein